MTNPLLDMRGLPPFSLIRPEHIDHAIDQVLTDNRAAVVRLLDAQQHYTWANLVAPLEELGDRLRRIWSPVGHMNEVINSSELRAAYNACLPKLSEYATELGQNERLYQASQAIADGDDWPQLATAKKKKTVSFAVRCTWRTCRAFPMSFSLLGAVSSRLCGRWCSRCATRARAC